MFKTLLALTIALGFVLGSSQQAFAQTTAVVSGYLAAGTSITSFVEVTGSAYARAPIALQRNFGTNVASTNIGITFGPNTGSSWGTVSELAIYDSPTNGNLLFWWVVSAPQAVASGATFSLSPLSVQFRPDITEALDASFSRQIESNKVIGAASNGGAVFAGVTLAAGSGMISVAGPSTYLGNIASDTAIPTGALAGANSFQTRSVHISWDNVTSLALVIPNWLVTSAGESGNTVPMTATASIEYPVGTFTQVKFSGSSSVTIANATTAVSDMASVTIPKGAVFYVRIHALMGNNYVPATVFGGTTINVYNAGTNVADQTMSGNLTVSQYQGQYFVPAAIIANTKIPSALLVGDSRLAGYNDSAEQGRNDPGNIVKGLSRGVPTINAGVAGDIAGSQSMTLRASLAQYATHVISEYGINNIRAGQTLAQLNSALATVYAYFPGKTILQTTLEPNTLSSDSWLTVTNQSAEPWESVRQAFNTQLRTYGMAGASGPIIDTAHCVETSSSGTTQPVDNGGFWMADGTTVGKYTGDGLHGFTRAYDAMASNGCVRPSVITR